MAFDADVIIVGRFWPSNFQNLNNSDDEGAVANFAAHTRGTPTIRLRSLQFLLPLFDVHPSLAAEFYPEPQSNRVN